MVLGKNSIKAFVFDNNRTRPRRPPVKWICQASCRRQSLGVMAALEWGPNGISDRVGRMNCICCGSAAVAERPEVTARRYRRFRCRDCGRQCNERSAGVLNRTCLPSDVIAFVVFCRLRYRLTLRDLCEILLRGIEVSHETVRDWETKLLPVMGDALRKRRRGMRRGASSSWYVDEMVYPGLA
jgi:transposase-like protein